MGRALAAATLLLTLLAATPAGAEPDPEVVGSSDWLSISAGEDHTCGIRRPGTLYCWGDNTNGELGNGSFGGSTAVPMSVSGATNWRSVSAGADHTCATRGSGRIWCWGADTAGQLGNGAPNESQDHPVRIAFADWTAVSAGGQHTCGRRATGRLYCWGSDSAGVLGDGGADDERSQPTLVAGGITNWTAVSAGDHHNCARRANGQVLCWGDDGDGQLGNGGGSNDRDVPTPIAGGGNWRSVSSGDMHSCAVRATGQASCWGLDAEGAIGDGVPAGIRYAPVQVVGPVTDWTSISAGGLHTCARRSTGELYCWGLDAHGQVGDGGTSTNRHAPSEVGGGATDWLSVDAGGFHSCARTRTGRAYCWGDDDDGEVGDGPTIADHSRPGEVFVS